MRNIIRQTAKILVLLAACSVSCSRHNTKSAAQIYEKAVKKYNKGKYYDAKQLFQEAIPLLKRKKEIIETQLYIAKCLFYDKEYQKSAHCFADFCRNYPKIVQTEEALYLQGYALYLDNPAVQLDNTRTEEAITVLKKYKSEYPTGSYLSAVGQYIRELQGRLAEKAFRNAKQYYKLGHYEAAIISIKNFNKTYLDTVYDEEASYLKFESQAELASSSNESQKELFHTALIYYRELVEQYPNSKYLQIAQKTYEKVLSNG